MAMTMNVSGMEEISRMLTEAGERAEEVASKALYAGAGVMADAYAAAASGITAEKFHYVFSGEKRGTSFEEKAALVGKSGIAKFEKNGSEVLTSVGPGGKLGYVEINGRKIAVRLLANAINKGTEFRIPSHVWRGAVSKAKGAASDAIMAKAQELLEQIAK